MQANVSPSCKHIGGFSRRDVHSCDMRMSSRQSQSWIVEAITRQNEKIRWRSDRERSNSKHAHNFNLQTTTPFHFISFQSLLATQSNHTHYYPLRQTTTGCELQIFAKKSSFLGRRNLPPSQCFDHDGSKRSANYYLRLENEQKRWASS